MMGELIVYWGSMFSGKTTRLIQDLTAHRDKSICFKPGTDTRDGVSTIKTHDGQKYHAITVDSPMEIMNLHLDPRFEVIGIEEASLFAEEESLIFVVSVLRDMGYKVIVTGLDMTSEGEPFGAMPHLAAIADHCEKLHAECAECGGRGYISHYKGGQKGVVEIGGADKYEPLCLSCWEGSE